jgi:hypothetical protein
MSSVAADFVVARLAIARTDLVAHQWRRRLALQASMSIFF